MRALLFLLLLLMCPALAFAQAPPSKGDCDCGQEIEIDSTGLLGYYTLCENRCTEKVYSEVFEIIDLSSPELDVSGFMVDEKYNGLWSLYKLFPDMCGFTMEKVGGVTLLHEGCLTLEMKQRDGETCEVVYYRMP